MNAVEARLAAIEARLAALEARGGTLATSNGETPTDTFSEDKLQNEWADKSVAKDLPRWKGESMVGRRFSECPAEWHDAAASFSEWKAAKGREENPLRINERTGKPWHERDTFQAKLHRTWAKHLRAMAASAPQAPAIPMDAGLEPDGLPF